MYKQNKIFTLIKILLLPLAAIIIVNPISAAPLSPATELTAILNNIHTLQATFEQSLINDREAKIGPKTTGTMLLERPGKFRWQITQPTKQLLIITGNNSLLYDAELAQVIKQKMDCRNPGNPALLLSSATASLTKTFKISSLKKPGAGSWFKLTPKTQNDQENGYQWIKLHFINGQLKAMRIADNLGQKSNIAFKQMVLNAKISPKLFLFTPPPNTEIFDAD